jgi:hypothetical protein
MATDSPSPRETKKEEEGSGKKKGGYTPQPGRKKRSCCIMFKHTKTSHKETKREETGVYGIS